MSPLLADLAFDSFHTLGEPLFLRLKLPRTSWPSPPVCNLWPFAILPPVPVVSLAVDRLPVFFVPYHASLPKNKWRRVTILIVQYNNFILTDGVIKGLEGILM